MRSKGIHVMVPKMTHGDALTVAAAGGHFFVLPWRGHTILGTTDTAFKGDPDKVSVSESDIAEFFAFVNKYLPSARLKRDAVEYFYAGLRPLVDDGSGNTYGASRRAELVDHGKDDGVAGLFSAIGGKWTTSRDLAETITDTIVARLGVAEGRCLTATQPLPGAKFWRFPEFVREQTREHPLPSIRHLAHMYGSRLPDMLEEAGNRPELRAPVGTTGDIAAQIVFAVREEMALTLADAVLRRTGIGQFGKPSTETLDTASTLMAKALDWSEERRLKEIAALAPWFQTREAA
jgi:glycerol-3-phosphate dehydrogenase